MNTGELSAWYGLIGVACSLATGLAVWLDDDNGDWLDCVLVGLFWPILALRIVKLVVFPLLIEPIWSVISYTVYLIRR